MNYCIVIMKLISASTLSAGWRHFCWLKSLLLIVVTVVVKFVLLWRPIINANLVRSALWLKLSLSLLNQKQLIWKPVCAFFLVDQKRCFYKPRIIGWCSRTGYVELDKIRGLLFFVFFVLWAVDIKVSTSIWV